MASPRLALMALLHVPGALSVPRPYTAQMWPRVYVYDLPEFWDMDQFAMHEMTRIGTAKKDPWTHRKDYDIVRDLHRKIFGERCENHDEFTTQMFAASMILLWRILRSPLYREKDPAKADLFFVPMWPKEKDGAGWAEVCAKEGNLDVEKSLKYLDEHTAHRHFFVVSKGHTKPTHHCDAWWREPTGLLRRAMRFAYSSDFRDHEGQMSYGPVRFDDDDVPNELEADLLDDDILYPHLVSIPYPSSLHARSISTTEFHQLHTINRTRLSTFLGKSHVGGNLTGGRYAVGREKIINACAARKDLCSFAVPRTKQKCGMMADEYVKATFCFEPGGDSPYRKGLYDAIMYGCIPVVFSLYNARVSPWHFWAGHRHNAMIIINETAFLDGEVDVMEHLLSISPKRIKNMQSALARNAHRLQYALLDYPDDAVDILLKGAWHMAETREASDLIDIKRRKAPRQTHREEPSFDVIYHRRR